MHFVSTVGDTVWKPPWLTRSWAGAAAGWTGGTGLGVGLGLAAGAGAGEGALGASSILRRASSCSCFSLACRRARSSSALFRSSSSFCLAMFSKRALMLPVLLPADERRNKRNGGKWRWWVRTSLEVATQTQLTLMSAYQPPQVWSSGKTGPASPLHQKSLHSVSTREIKMWDRALHIKPNAQKRCTTLLTLSILSFWTPNFPPNPLE